VEPDAKYPRFSDFAEPADSIFDGQKIDLNSILDKEILIIGYKVRPSKHSDENYLTLQFEMDGQRFVVFTGSTVLTDQIGRYADKIPFYAKITRLGKYYSFI
jgi:hypothetical protein